MDRLSTVKPVGLAGFIIALAVMLMPISSLHAGDTVPLCGLICFHSTDSSPVDVTMTHELQPARQVHLEIPRSALIFVPGYKALKLKALPDHVEVLGHWMTFAVVAPEGRPFGEVVEEVADQNGLSLDAAATSLRPRYAVVDASIIGRDVTDERLYSANLLSGSDWTDLKSVEPFDGLPGKRLSFEIKNVDGKTKPTTVDGHKTNYFPLDRTDPFLMIQCENQPDPVFWCDYIVRPNDLVVLRIHMSDFRFYGGRTFVRDRLNMILRAYCGYDLACNR